MKYLFNIFFILIYGVSSLKAQEVKKIKVFGRITDSLGTGINGVNLMAKSSVNKNVFAYASTHNNGEYSLSFETNEKSAVMEASCLNYAEKTQTIVLNKKNIACNMMLSEAPVELSAVIIKPKFRDTMGINTKKMVLNERSTLRDILDQTEGFIVEEDGGISFMGKPIQKVLVNKKEVFVNQNKIALDNLNFKMMDSLQLINNYKDKFKIDFDNFTEPVINIDTKKEFKGILKISSEADAGVENKYKIKPKGFFFSDKINFFAVSNTNNIGQKDFSFKDISSAFKKQSSGFFQRQVTPFFLEDELSKDAFDSDTNITLRKEGNRYRSSLVVYYNHFLKERETESITTENNNEKVKEEKNNLQNRGDFLTGQFDLNYIIGRKTGLSLSSNFGYAHTKSKEKNTIQNHIPSEVFISEDKREKPESVIGSNQVEVTNMPSKNTKLQIRLSHHFEHSKNDFSSNYAVADKAYNPLLQAYNFKNNDVDVYTNFEKKFNKLLNLSAGLEISTFKEEVNYPEMASNQPLREGNLYSPFLRVRGERKFLKYYAKIASQSYAFRNSKDRENKIQPEINTSMEYTLNANNRLWIEYERRNHLLDLYNDLDTLSISFNERLIRDKPINHTVSNENYLALGYFYANIARSEGFNVSYTAEREHNILQPIYWRIENNVFFYKNTLIDRQKSQKIKAGASKGFYFSENYHKLSFGTSVSGDFSQFPSIVHSKEVNFSTKNMKYSGEISFEPRKFIFSELALHALWNAHKLYLEKNNINTQKRFLLTGEISKKKDQFDYKLIAGYQRFKNEEVDFSYPILNVETTIKLSRTIELSILGQNLIHLFNKDNNPYTGLNIHSDGNLINKNINRYNLNYFVIGISYKP